MISIVLLSNTEQELITTRSFDILKGSMKTLTQHIGEYH